jgi:hypothetical protein
MKPFTYVLPLLLLCKASTPAWCVEPEDIPPVLVQPAKVGNVYIVGNTFTKDSVIRGAIELCPGETLRYGEVRAAEKRLAALGLFESGKDRPTIRVVDDTESVFKDIVVIVKEKATTFWEVTPSMTPADGPALTLIWETRWFDPKRPPCREPNAGEPPSRAVNRAIRIEAPILNGRIGYAILEHVCSAACGLR